MGASERAKNLIAAMEEFEVIDCHEHIGPERERLGQQLDALRLFSCYNRPDIHVAGMSDADVQKLFEPDIPLERRWQMFKPYLERMRWTSYARAAFITAKGFYGFDDINDETYKPLSEAMQKANTPGIYERILRDACKIRTTLTQGIAPKDKTPLLTPVVWVPLLSEDITWEKLARPGFAPDTQVRSLDDLADALRGHIVGLRRGGTVGLKMFSQPFGNPSRKEAHDAFEALRAGTAKSAPILPPFGECGVMERPVTNVLRDYLADRACAFAAELDLVMCIHTGYWGDFRELHPLHMIPVLQRHPGTKFDIYHVGYPFVRDALMLGKGFANVWLNFCWTHIISPRFATAALDEAIDLIPTNKILGFGGDYESATVEKAYGHLVMARENIARVLARRIEEGQFNEAQALDLAHRWLFENPVDLYKLDV